MVTKQNIKEVLELIMQTEHSDFEAKMKFGSKGYELRGNLCAGVFQDMIVLNLGKERVDEMLKLAHTRPMDIIGRVLEDWIMLEEPIYENDEYLKELLKAATDRVRKLPRKF